MNAVLRKIVHIDEEKCNGCGLCVPSCAEGAIQIVNGKARLINETFCDGLGACLGECPEDAITIEEREAPEFDESAVAKYLTASKSPPPAFQACPGSAAQSFNRNAAPSPAAMENGPSCLGNWPIQLHLVSPQVPFLRGADLLICADCAPFAYAGFHQDFLKGKTLVIGCPKLDDVTAYQQKLTRIFAEADIESITVLHMEVPCCHGLSYIVKQALAAAAKDIPLDTHIIGVKGNKL